MKTILIISFSPLSRDPRVRRQIELLNKNYNIITAGLDDPEIQGVKYIQCNNFFDNVRDKIKYSLCVLTKNFSSYYWYKYTKLHQILNDEKFDLIISNDPEPLPLACRLIEEKNINLIADMHEYSPREGEGNLKWEIFFKPFKEYLCAEYLEKASVVTTVCQGIMDEYKDEYRLKEIQIITNAPRYIDNTVRKTNDNCIKLVHHGMATQQRKIETMLEMMKYVDEKYHLDLYLIPGDKKYIDKLKERYQKDENITFREPVAHQDINNMLKNYDIGIYILPDAGFNERFALPNKFFEFVQARLAIAIGPSKEMVRYLNNYHCGIAANDFSPQTMANLLNNLSAEDIDCFKRNADLMAKQECAENNMRVLENIIEKII